jgi:glucose uptake protein
MGTWEPVAESHPRAETNIMFIIETYTTAIIFCTITMLCWGSWANTQKMVEETWRFELFYWDYVWGVVLLSLILAATLGSFGSEGRGFIEDLLLARTSSLANAFIGGVVFNLANILIVAAIAIAGMSVAFPVGIGLALVLGVLINYVATPYGDPLWLFLGVGSVALAIVLDALAYRKKATKLHKPPAKGVLLSIAGGILMSLFYRFVARSMVSDFASPEPGMLTPYSAVFVFSMGVMVSNLLFNTVMMRRPVEGKPLGLKAYLRGSRREHFTGILGGMIWCIGMSFSIIAAGKAGFAISYGLGQGATMIAALWGVFVWKEFKDAPKGTGQYIIGMFLCFVVGLSLIVYAGV